jgi:hypothetical protein
VENEELDPNGKTELKTDVPEKKDKENGEVKNDKGESETSSPKKPENIADEDSDIPDIPADKVPKSDDYRTLREKTKEFKRKLKEAEERLKGLEGQKVPMVGASTEPQQIPGIPAQSPQAQPEKKQTVALERLIDVLQKAQKGEFGDRSEEYIVTASEMLSDYSPYELAEELKKANRGAFGDASAEIAQKLKDQIPLATANWQKRQEDSRQGQILYQQIADSRRRAEEKHPELKDPKSEFSGLYAKVAEEIIGVFDQSGNLVKPGIAPNLLNHPQVSELLAEQTRIRIMAERARELEKTVKEKDELKKKLEKITAPEGGSGRRAQQLSAEDQDLEDIRNEIRMHQAAMK